MGIKRIKTRSQRITSSGYLKKIQILRIAADSGYFKKPHRTVGFHKKPEKRSQAGFWAVILLLQFGIWVSGPQQTNRRDLGFKTSTNRLTELTKILKKSPAASPASPSPTPQNSRHRQTDRTRLSEFIY